ncbi:unnamed protein product [Amaranthus hypochondriacus]
MTGFVESQGSVGINKICNGEDGRSFLGFLATTIRRTSSRPTFVFENDDIRKCVNKADESLGKLDILDDGDLSRVEFNGLPKVYFDLQNCVGCKSCLENYRKFVFSR